MDATWRKLIEERMVNVGDSFLNIESTTLTEDQLDTVFDCGYGGSQGCPFTVWTKNYVYFPVVYDGAEWVACVPRNPNGKATKHVGGE
jgi:hypothetical protein